MENSPKSDAIVTALFIMIVPTIWAVFSPKFGIETGAVSLICAGLFTAEGNRAGNALKMVLGLIIGIPWGIIALRFTLLPGNHSFNQFLVLCVLGGAAVLLCALTPLGRWVDSTAWLVGWAITILVMGHVPLAEWSWFPLQLALSMIVGIYIIGVGSLHFKRWVEKKFIKK